MLEEFKKFAIRGNVIDLAVGVIIGAAFTSIVNSLVDDIIMPAFNVVFGGLDFSKLSIGVIHYGKFINAIVQFLLIAFVLFLIIRQVNKFSRKEEAKQDTKSCPFCFSKISREATRCPNCTSKI